MIKVDKDMLIHETVVMLVHINFIFDCLLQKYFPKYKFIIAHITFVF